MDLEYHKAQLCIHKFMICQEGFCSECDIHAQHERHMKQLGRELTAKVRLGERATVKV